MDNRNKIILDLCGGTGAWSKPYKDAGYDVRNITLPENDVKIYEPPDNVYGILAAPPCTEFSFAKSNSKYPRNMIKGMEIVIACLRIIWQVQYNLPSPLAKRTNLKFWCLENPFGLLRRYLGHPVIIFEPYYYGDYYQKKTCLWGFFNIPKVKINKNYSKDFIHKISPTGKQLKKFTAIPKFSNVGHIDFRYKDEFANLKREERRSITSPYFAQAFFEANK